MSRNLWMGFLALALCGAHCAEAVAGPIGVNSVLVYRVGTGSGSLVNAGNAVFVDVFDENGTLTDSIAMPTTASGTNKQLIASGTATSEGFITVSENNDYVTVSGYGRDLGVSGSVVSTTSASVPRTVGIIPTSTGVPDTSTALSDWASANNPRSAVTSDGTNIWVAGAAGGVRSTTLGATTSIGVSSATNVRQVNIFDGQLYASSSSTGGSNTVALGSLGAGLPTSGSIALSSLPGLPLLAASPTPSIYAYFLTNLSAAVPGNDTLYVADDSSRALSKWSLVGGSWVLNGTIGVDADDYRGVDGWRVGHQGVMLFATRKGGSGAAGGGELVKLFDNSGYNGAFIGNPVVIATAAANTAFRGVAVVIPEPATMTLFSLALIGVAGLFRRR